MLRVICGETYPVLLYDENISSKYKCRTYEGIPKRAIEPEFSSFRNSYKSEEHNKFQELVKKYGFYPELCDTCRKGNLLKIKSKRRFYKSLCGGMTRDLLIKPFFVYKGLSFNSICVTEPGRTVRPADHIS